MPSRYVQSIYKQYTIFLKDPKAQQAAAAEDMMEELEDGGGLGGAMPPPNNSSSKSEDINSIRERQLAAMKANIERGPIEEFSSTAPDPKKINIREAQLAQIRANIMAGRTENIEDD